MFQSQLLISEIPKLMEILDKRHSGPPVRAGEGATDGTRMMVHCVVAGARTADITLAIFFIAVLLTLIGADYGTVRSYLTNPGVAIPLILLILSSTLLMSLGMRLIIEDYLHASTPKIASPICNSVFSAVAGLSCVCAVLKIGLNS